MNRLTRSWRRLAGAASLSLAAVGLAAVPPASAAVTIIDLGVLPGGTYSSGWAVNTSGKVIGVAMDPVTFANRQVLFGGGVASPFGTYCCSGGQATPKALNDGGEAVGTENGGYATNGIYWDSTGRWVVLPGLPGGLPNRVAAYDINNNGTIVGMSRDAAQNRHAVVWERGVFSRDLGFMGQASAGFANYTVAEGINNLGDIVGQGVVGQDYHAFVYRAGAFTDLGLGEAVDINESGVIAGHSPTRGQAVVWRNGVKTPLPSLSGDAVSFGHFVTDINSNGDVVGYTVPPGATSLRNTAVLWRGGRAIDLGRYPGGDASAAYGINDAGQVVGEGTLVPGGPMHALMWITGSTTATNTNPTVTLSATTSAQIRPGGSVTFKGSFTDPDNGPWTYTFAWGDGTTSTGTTSVAGTLSASKSFLTAGRFSVTLTVNDAKGGSGKSSAVQVRVR